MDNRDIKSGEKGWGWVRKGIPLRVEIGPRDIESNSVFVLRRDTMEKVSMDKDEFVNGIVDQLKTIQNDMLERALKNRAENSREIDDYETFKKFFTPENAKQPEIHGGFAHSHWCGCGECEDVINDDLSVTIRCIPFDYEKSGEGVCVHCGEPSKGRVVFAKSY